MGASLGWAAQTRSAIDPLLRTVDLNVGEAAKVKLCDGRTVEVRLVSLKEVRDPLRSAVREARVGVEVDGQAVTLVAAYYRLPVTVGKVQIDCAVTKGCVQAKENPWSLDKDARLRLWPAGSPWIQPGTFRYPAKQKWFATDTQMANDPVYVDGGERIAVKQIYYHNGLDIGGAEGLVEVVAASDGVIQSAGLETIQPANFPEHTVRKRYDVVYLLDGRGWYHRYSHLYSIDPAIRPGVRVKMGQRIGLLGKEGGSGGWSHLHFDLSGMQPSGRYGTVEGYAFFWQAYQAEHGGTLEAVARPHHFTAIGQPVRLDGSLSRASRGKIVRYEWTLSDGTRAEGPTVVRSYARPGVVSEILKVTDSAGQTDYDFAVVQVVDPGQPKQDPPSIHAVFWPTEHLKPGQEIVFKVRSFRIRADEGCERWDFGDGTPPVEVRSDGNAVKLAKDGYAVTKHRYATPGDWLVSVERTNDRGEKATARLHVRVEAEKK
jgi:murein DD-endopeptidase MepM/ murein hydrolase activator NlpD